MKTRWKQIALTMIFAGMLSAQAQTLASTRPAGPGQRGDAAAQVQVGESYAPQDVART